MGDSRRNEEFAKFIFRQFPPKKYRSVLVVADGKAELARYLSAKYKVRVVENKPRQKHKRKHLIYTKGWFTSSSEVLEDFVVGMHPDEATAEIIKAAERNNKRWSVVPCCIKGIEAHGVKNFKGWLRKLKSLSKRDPMETLLPIGGKNTVLWSNK